MAGRDARGRHLRARFFDEELIVEERDRARAHRLVGQTRRGRLVHKGAEVVVMHPHEQVVDKTALRLRLHGPDWCQLPFDAFDRSRERIDPVPRHDAAHTDDPVASKCLDLFLQQVA